MREIIEVVFPVSALFLIAICASYLVAVVIRKARRQPVPILNGRARVRATSGVYRSRFLGVSASGWRFSAPICRDHYVPFRVGEDLTIEIADETGLLRFRTVVVERDATEHVFTMQTPTQVFRADRRVDERRYDLAGMAGELEGAAASILNVSQNGVCVVSDQRVKPGDRVKLILPWESKPTFGWVVGREGSERFCSVRIRVDEPLSLPVAA